MTDRISGSSDLASEAFLAASRRLSERSATNAGSDLSDAFRQRAEAMLAERGVAPTERTEGTARSGFAGAIEQGIGSINAELQAADRLPEDMLTGAVSSPAEIAARIKRADLTLKYSLEIRNRLVDAYREVMRMSI